MVNPFHLQILSIQQLYKIGTMYWEDKYDIHSLSPDVFIFYVYIFYFLDKSTPISKSQF
ncbi:hypothetical protein Hanom_Chr00s003340g01712031 [Helianthus anomalus]